VQVLEARVVQLEGLLDKYKQVLENVTVLLENANRMKCMNNLKMLYIGMVKYAEHNDENFPPDLSVLCNKYISDMGLFICPGTDSNKAKRVAPPDDEPKKSTTIPVSNMSYCYVTGLNMSDPPEYILAFDEETNHKGVGVNVCYVSAIIRWQTDIPAVQAQLRKQEGELKAKGREMKLIRPSDETKKAQP
jgi:hypothetical protein